MGTVSGRVGLVGFCGWEGAPKEKLKLIGKGPLIDYNNLWNFLDIIKINNIIREKV